MEMDPQKVQAIMDWQAPRTRKQLQSFLRFANFYRQFIPAFTRIALPLTDLLRTKHFTSRPRLGQPLNWTTACHV